MVNLDDLIEWPDDARPSWVRHRFATRGRCRRCGCTPHRGCFRRRGPGCWWTNMRETLCSRCVSYPGRRRYRRRRLGHARALQIRAWYAERAALAGVAEQLRWEARHAAVEDQRDVLLASAAAVERYAADGPVVTVCKAEDLDPATLAALGALARATIAAAERHELPRSEL